MRNEEAKTVRRVQAQVHRVVGREVKIEKEENGEEKNNIDVTLLEINGNPIKQKL